MRHDGTFPVDRLKTGLTLIRKIPLIGLLLGLLLVSTIGMATSPSSPNVPVGDPVYRDIDKLVAAGLAKDLIYGHRPWSRSEIVRIIRVAMEKRNLLGPAADSHLAQVDRILDRLENSFREELSGHHRPRPITSLQAEYTLTDLETRAIHDNGFGSVNASIEPLTAYREGRRYPDGHQISLETEHFLQVSRYFSFYGRPRLQWDISHDGETAVKPFIQQLYGKFGILNFELEVGRDSVVWGQGESGGILLSNNARPFDMIKLSNPTPKPLPWLFKYLGPFRYTFFVANLGPEREFPYSYLTGLKISAKPVSFFEIGFGQTLVLGGDGAPGPLSFTNIIQEIFASTFTDRVGDINTINLSNRETGFDFRFFLPFLRNSQVYLDVQFEDDSSERLFMLTDLASYQAGVYIPRLDNTGRWDLRFDYRHGSPYFYRHSLFTTGMSLNGRLWGDELGPQADGAYVTLSYDYSPDLWLSGTFQLERRDGDLLAELKDADGSNRRVVATTPRPAEFRTLWKTTGVYRFQKPVSLSVELAYERISSFNFSSGDDRNGFLGRIGFRFDFL